ncbi:GNAT family N-acetyltransferase [Planomicrobium sp. CPCC 101079]|nr:GNAT family N-acetyltransferase [Planomicrobium sp. CPCC 101079]
MQICEAGHPADFQSEIEEVLSFATSKAREEYRKYLETNKRKLYVYKVNEAVGGCIGIELIADNNCVIKHIAVSLENRGQRIGSKMIGLICEKYKFSSILAETDQDAVDFYRRIGFETKSLGEKYPGRERFLCQKNFSQA